MPLIFKPIQKLALFLNRFSWGFKLNLFIYELSLNTIALILRNTNGAESIFARGSTATGGLYPGLSDIDLHFVLEKMTSSKQLTFLKHTFTKLKFLQTIFPFLKKVYLYTSKEMTIYQLCGRSYHFDLENLHRHLGGKKISLHNITTEQKKIAFMKIISRRYSKYLLPRYFKGELRPNRKNILKPNRQILLDTCHLTHLLPDKKEFIFSKNFQDFIDEKNNPNLTYLIKRFLFLSNNHFRVEDEKKHIEEELEHWFFLLNKLLAEWNTNGIDNSLPQFQIQLTKHQIPPKTKQFAQERISPLIESISKELKDLVTCVLSASPNTYFGFRLFIIPNASIQSRDFLPLTAKIRDVVQACGEKIWKPYFLSYPTPLLFSQNSFKKMNLFHSSGLENYYLVKHGSIFPVKHSSSLPVVEKSLSVPSHIADYETYTGFLRTDHKESKSRKKFAYRFFNCSLGKIPGDRLLYEKGIVTTTPEETMEEYAQNYQNDYLSFMKESANLFDPSREEYEFNKIHSFFLKNYSLLKEAIDINYQFLEKRLSTHNNHDGHA